MAIQEFRQFSLIGLLGFTTLSCLVLGIIVAGGAVLSSYVSLLLLSYIGSRLCFRRGVRIQFAIMCFVFASLPCLGYLTGLSPGSGSAHPMLRQPEGLLVMLVYILLKLLYLVAQQPLQMATICHADIFDFVYFNDQSPFRVRPLAIGIFWLGMGLTFLAAGLALNVKCARGEVR